MLFQYLVAASMLAQAFAGFINPTKVGTVERCTTALAKTKPSHRPIPTSKKRLTVTPIHVKITQHYTPVATSTPPASTIVVTIVNTTTTTTTDMAITDTFTSVSTETDTSTSTEFDTSTSTSTVSTTLYQDTTSTIPAPAGFTDAYDSTGDETCGDDVSCGCGDDVSCKAKRAQKSPSRPRLGSEKRSQKQHVFAQRQRYPKSVNCVDRIQTTYAHTTTKTAKTSTTTLAPVTKTVNTTTVSTSTVTSAPADVSTTVTQMTTTTTTSVTTSSVQTTTTTTDTYVVGTTTTIYAACATDNILGPPITPVGNIIDGIDAEITSIFNSDNGYDCCVACFTDPLCQLGSYEESGGQCYIRDGSDPTTCASPSYAQFFAVPPNEAEFAGQVFNGPCGGLWQDEANT